MKRLTVPAPDGPVLPDERKAEAAVRLARLEDALRSGAPAQAQGSAHSAPAGKAEGPGAAERDTPPWEEERPPLPDEPGERVEMVPEAPAPKPAAAAPEGLAPAAGVSGDFWPALVQSLRGRVPMGEYTFLNNPAMVQGRAENGVLTLYADSDFTRSMIHKPPVLEAVKAAGSALLGNVFRVEVVVGSAPAASAAANPPASGGDELDELLAFGQQFDNIIIKE